MRRSAPSDPEQLRKELVHLIQNFEAELHSADLRSKVKSLIPAYHKLRDLGASLLPIDDPSGRERVIAYLLKFPRQVVHGDELMVISGIGEWARRVRELRKEAGWSIITGVTAREIAEAEREEEGGPLEIGGVDISSLRPEEYVLLDEKQDKEAAHRWNEAKTIRNKKASVQDKVLELLRRNIGKLVTGEELRYVAKDKTEWARRVRELRTQEGWPVLTKTTGRPDLPVGVYVLKEDRQLPTHDRHIPKAVRVAVLKRDRLTCQEKGCGWNDAQWSPSDPRHLELHHIIHHAKRGLNTEENLITLCNIHHDEIHAREKTGRA
jgi:hypothetical protein